METEESGEAYLLAVQTALISLDANELLAADGETIGKGVGAGGEGRCQGVDVLLGELSGLRVSIIATTENLSLRLRN
jgi:hypothetical protein